MTTDAQYNRHHSGRNYYNYGQRGYTYARPYRPIYSPGVYSTYGAPYRYSHFGPAFGLRVNILPFGYNSIYIGHNPYYYYQGVYYRPYNAGGYQVTAPPLGAKVSRLPAGAKTQVIDGQKYYELGGTFYQEQIDAKNHLSYKVVGTEGVLNTTTSDPQTAPAEKMEPTKSIVDRPTGTKVNELPVDSKTVVINQQKYFQSPDGTYYMEIINRDVVSYQVVGTTVRP